MYGDDGQPLYSWRVLLLPYFEEQKLFDDFRLDEPWDSEHNHRLLDQMPKSYEVPWKRCVDVPPHHTVYHVLVGPSTAFERDGLSLSADFPDGLENTLLFVEAGEPVPWTKPGEIAFNSEYPPQQLQGLFKDGFRACSADGAYRFIMNNNAHRVIRSAGTRNGGESDPWAEGP